MRSDELPATWASVPLSEFAIGAGRSIQPQQDPEEVFDLYSVPAYEQREPEQAAGSDIKSNKQEVAPGQVLLCKIVPHLNRVWVVGEEGERRQIASGEWIRYSSPATDPWYLRYLLSSPDFREEFMTTVSGVGGSLLRARPQLVDKIQVPVPPLNEQRRIVAKLDRLSARSAAARDHLARVEKLAARAKQAILAAAFRGTLTEEWRAAADNLESAADLVARTPEPKQSRGGRDATKDVIEGIGGISVNDPGTELPEGWSWVRLRRIARQETGHTPSRSHPEWWGGDVPWIGIKDANRHHGRVIDETLQTINDDGLANSSARLLPAGTVCLSRTASVGYVTMMGRPMATSQDFATWTCTDALEPNYLLYALMSEGDDIRRFGEGSTHTTIYFPEIRAFHIKLAPLEEQREIVRRIEAAFARIDRLTAEAGRAAHLLARLDERLLAKAFRGELVPQDPTDEPARALLARIRQARAAAPKPKRGRRTKAAAK